MRFAAIVVVLACACKKPPAAVPGASVERWTTAARAVCTDVKVDPAKQGELTFRCTPNAAWKPSRDDARATIQLDDDGQPTRLAFEAVVADDFVLAMPEQLLRAYKAPDTLVAALAAGSGDERTLTGDGVRFVIAIHHVPGRSELFHVRVTLDAP